VRIKVATWNMDHHKRSLDLRAEAWRYLTETIRPDIALLQEASPPLESRTPSLLVWREISKARKWGSAVISRQWPLRSIQLAVDSHPGAVAVAEVQVPDQDPLIVASMYGLLEYTQYETYEMKYSVTSVHRMLSDLTAMFDSKEGRRFLLGGDLNISPQVSAPHSLRHKVVLDRIEAFGFLDCLKAMHTEVVQTHRHTGSSVPWQEDYIFAGRGLREKLVSCDPLDEEEVWRLSDHCPVVAVFDL
jgi:exonuclease III